MVTIHRRALDDNLVTLEVNLGVRDAMGQLVAPRNISRLMIRGYFQTVPNVIHVGGDEQMIQRGTWTLYFAVGIDPEQRVIELVRRIGEYIAAHG